MATAEAGGEVLDLELMRRWAAAWEVEERLVAALAGPA